MGHAAHNGYVEIRHVCELVRIIWLGGNSFTKVFAHFGSIHVNAERELDIADVIPAQPRVHDAWDNRVVCGIFIKLNSLYE